MIDDSTLVG